MADEQIIISLRSRLLSLTMRMYSSMTGRRGKPSVKRCQVGHPADGLDLLVPGQFVCQRDDIDGPLLVHQLGHAQVDTSVRVEREIVGLDPLGGLGMGGVVQQNGAEDGLFGINISRQSGVKELMSGRVAIP